MIQRIQSVYLLIAALLTGVMFVPTSLMDSFQLVWRILIYAGWGLSVIFTLLAIFQFKNRSKQVKSCLVSMLAIACAYVVLIWRSMQIGEQAGFNPLIAFPMIAFILIIMAIIAIRKDEKLVRSADRLR
jgi:membrane protein CcdC involved in cytochrome C biogenesis